MVQFPTALERFHAHLTAQRVAKRTLEQYLGGVKRLQRELGDLASASPTQLQQWRKQLGKRFEADTISQAKVRADVNIVKRFFAALTTTDLGAEPVTPLLAENPADFLRGMPRQRWKPRPMPRSEVDRLFAVCQPLLADGTYDLVILRDRALLGLYLNAVRNTEACSIQLNHLRYDPKERTLVLTVQGKGHAKKGPKIALLALHHDVAEGVALYALLRFAPDVWREWVQAARAGETLGLDQRSVAVFLAFDRLQRKRMPNATVRLFELSRREANTRFARWRRRAELPKYETHDGKLKEYGPHSLRHSCATFLLEANVDSVLVRDIMRHADVATTQMYLETTVSQQTRAVQELRSPGLPLAGV
jgi:site-specific recombinase XerD